MRVKHFRLDPTVSGIWWISYLCSTMSFLGKWIWDWFTSMFTFTMKLWQILRENHFMMRSRLFRCNEPKTKCSVRYRRNCLRSEFRYLVYAISQLRFREFCSAQIICRLQWNIFAWTLLLVEFDGYPIFAALCHTLESEFGIGLLLCVDLRWK